MKLISLNVYGGKVFEPLMGFIKSHAADTYIFCFQEVLDTSQDILISHGARANLFTEFKKTLPEFNSFFAVTQEHYELRTLVPEEVNCGQAIFVNKKYQVEKVGDFLICNSVNSFIPGDFGTLPCKAHYLQIIIHGVLLTVCNIHGTSEPGNKLDSPNRLTQSQKILDFVTTQPGEKIIAGDFNLLPTTESVAMFEKIGFQNLVREFAISTTRGSFMKTLHPQYGPDRWQEFADYTFVSSGIKTVDFTVPDVPISDHLPMILDFEIKI